MSKIICEVCGTSYPETASQCPICGYVNPGVQSAADKGAGEKAQYQHVKGGRFSKNNVKKRTQVNQAPVHNTTTERTAPRSGGAYKGRSSGKKKGGNSAGLIITAIVLLLAIVAVVVYLSVRFFGPGREPMLPVVPTGTTPSASEPAGTTAPQNIACTKVTVDVPEILLEKAGASRMIYVQTEPSDTTDTVTFSSDNEGVATVSPAGMITAVGSGKANITITCGTQTAVCVVTCAIPEETTSAATDPTEDTTAPTTEPTEPQSAKSPIALNRMDITFSVKGETWVLYEGSVSKGQVTFVSDNESVVTFKDGVVTAVGAGTTKVHVKCDGYETQTCIIRCTFSGDDPSGIQGNGGGVAEDD